LIGVGAAGPQLQIELELLNPSPEASKIGIIPAFQQIRGIEMEASKLKLGNLGQEILEAHWFGLHRPEFIEPGGKMITVAGKS